MKFKIFPFLLLIIILFGGCATSKYRPAEKFLAKEDYANAIRAYLRLLEPHMRNGKRYIYYDREAVTGIGRVYWQMHKYDTAVKILQMVVNKDPTYGAALFYLGMSLEGLGKEDEAIQIYKRYTSLPYYDPYHHVLMGRLDWLVRRKIFREVQLALKNERQLNINSLPEKTVAVLYFLSLSNDPQWRPLQKGLAEMLITDLSQVKNLKVVERLRLNYIMKELELSTTGLVDEKTAPRLGKLMGARTLIKGSYMVMPGPKITMNAGIYEIGMPFSPTTANFEGTLTRLFRMEKELVLRVIDYFEIRLTPQERERILRIPTQNMMAFMDYCRGLDAMDHADFSKAQSYFEKAVKIDPKFGLAKNHLTVPKIWEATHNSNSVRVNYEVTNLIKAMPKGKPEVAYNPPAFVSTWNRLLWMRRHQKGEFFPGNDSRKSFQEADEGSSLVPTLLGMPPPPMEK